MFKAIVNGKYRGLDDSKINSESSQWSEIYKGAEDFETAAIFTRLSYLPPEHFWAILQQSFLPVDFIFPNYAGNLHSIDFWPRFDDPTDSGDWVEPDILVGFEEISIIFEIKRGDQGNPQTSEQLIREWSAVKNVDDNFSKNDMCLFSLGGMTASNQELLKSETGKDLEGFRFATSSWRTLAKTIRNYRIPSNPQADRILKDLIEILAFHGHKDYLWATQLATKAKNKKWQVRSDSCKTLSSWFHQ